MSSFTNIDWFAFFFIIFFLIFVGIYKTKWIKSESIYLFAGRKTKWFALTATLVMTEFNSATLISFSSIGYGAGLWALFLPLIFLIGLLFYACTVAKKWKEFNGFSVAGYFNQRYGKGLGSCSSILLLTAMVGFSAAYIKSLTLIFHPLFPKVDPWILSGSLFVLVLVMSLRGGLIAVIRTDLISFVLMVLFFPLTGLFMWKSSTLPPITYPASFVSEGILPLRFVFSLTVLTMFTYILAPWYGQKIFAAESGKAAYWSVIAAAIIVFFLYGSAILATAFFKYRGFQCDSWEQSFPRLIDLCLPSGIKGFAYALLFATSATTLTGVWSAMSAMFIGDFLKQPSLPDLKDYKRSLISTVCFACISFVLANTLIDKVFDKLILANIPVAALSFGLLAGFYWKKTSRIGVFISIIVGCLCASAFYWIYGEAGGYTWYWAVFGIPITFMIGMIGSLLFPEKKFSIPKSL